MKNIVFLLLVSFPLIGFSQNVGIGTPSPSAKLEIKDTILTTLKISSKHYADTSQLILSNRNSTNQGTDFLLKSRSELGLFISSQSDLAGNASDNSLVIKPNGRIGIKNVNPAYALDVAGDINTTGVLRVSGSAGSDGQILKSNGNGTMSWDNMCQYQNFVSLVNTGSGNWTVPAGVTRILVEVWAAGGGGNLNAAGGGGGYIMGHFDVTPGAILNYIIGAGGANAVTNTASSGGNSIFTVGTATLTAIGGSGAVYGSSTSWPGGGSSSGTATGTNNFIAVSGSPGGSRKQSFYQYDATTFYETGESGRGGNAGNTSNTGGLGTTYLYNTTGSIIIRRSVSPPDGLVPGGGGASGVQTGGTQIISGNGANGLIIIRY